LLAELHRSPNPTIQLSPGLLLAELHRSPNPTKLRILLGLFRPFERSGVVGETSAWN